MYFQVKPDMLELRVPVWLTDIAFLGDQRSVAISSRHKHASRIFFFNILPFHPLISYLVLLYLHSNCVFFHFYQWDILFMPCTLTNKNFFFFSEHSIHCYKQTLFLDSALWSQETEKTSYQFWMGRLSPYLHKCCDFHWWVRRVNLNYISQMSFNYNKVWLLGLGITVLLKTLMCSHMFLLMPYWIIIITEL